MIDINLIPPALRRNSKGNANSVGLKLPKEILLGVGVGLIVIMMAVHLFLGAIWFSGTGRLAIYKADWQKVVPDKTQFDSLNKESMALAKKVKIISDMTTQKFVLWAPKFNAISDALPRGLWIRKMTLDKTSLTMEGSIVSKNQNEINNVGMFLFALKQNDNFMNGISSLEVNSIQRGKDNAVEVTDFTVMAKLK